MAITAQDVLDRMRWNIGGEIRDWSDDGLLAGKTTTEVKGIATTFSPNLDILKRGVAAGKNMFVVREGPYWINPPGYGSEARRLDYAKYANALRERSAQLSDRFGHAFTPVMVERALWATRGGSSKELIA